MSCDLLPILLVVVPLTASAALSDVRTGLIPNRLVAFGLLAGCIVRAAAFSALPEHATMPIARAALGSVLGACSCAAVPYLLFRLGAMGGGDVKLLGAVGAAVGSVLGVRIELFAFILAALYAVARLALQGKVRALLSSTAALVVGRFFSSSARRPAPAPGLLSLRFGPAIFFSTLWVAAERWWWS